MSTEKISLTGAQETLLITLYAKGRESELPDSLLRDRLAAEAVRRIDYDFDALEVGRDMAIGVAMRSRAIDEMTRDFLRRHPEAVVLHLGCGLDTRVFRIAPGPGVLWIDLDYPGVVDLRRRLYPSPRGDYALIGASVTEAGWLDRVPADRPAIVLCEGLTPYLPDEEAPKLFHRLARRLLEGELVFDAYSRLGLDLLRKQPSIRRTGAELHWSLEDPSNSRPRSPA